MKIMDKCNRIRKNRVLASVFVIGITTCLLVNLVLHIGLQNFIFALASPSPSGVPENMTKSNITRTTTAEGNISTNANAASPYPPKFANSSSTFPSNNNVEIVLGAALKEQKAFQPNPVNIKAAGQVTWTNKDTVVHTVTSGTGFSDTKLGEKFDSGLLGGTFAHRFNIPGTYPYFCQIHPTMIGSVVVG